MEVLNFRSLDDELEERRIMRTLFLSCLSKVCWLFPLIVLLIGYTTNAACTATRSASISTNEPMSEEIPDFSKFVGPWYAHGAGLTVKANGQAHYEARVYTWCGPGVQQPCDSMKGNEIINGYKGDIQFFRVSDTVAYGTITSGNIQPVGSYAMLILLPENQLLFSAGKGMGNHLCGPNAPAEACGA
jgi:hypothetical protein